MSSCLALRFWQFFVDFFRLSQHQRQKKIDSLQAHDSCLTVSWQNELSLSNRRYLILCTLGQKSISQISLSFPGLAMTRVFNTWRLRSLIQQSIDHSSNIMHIVPLFGGIGMQKLHNTNHPVVQLFIFRIHSWIFSAIFDMFAGNNDVHSYVTKCHLYILHLVWYSSNHYFFGE